MLSGHCIIINLANVCLVLLQLEEMSGGGLLCEWAGRWEVVGVAMSHTGCYQGSRPRLYDDITTNTVKWIKKTIAAFQRNS